MNAQERADAVKRFDAISFFVDWLYEDGPDPNTVTRVRLLEEYKAHLRVQAALDIFSQEENTNVVPFKR